MSGTARQWSDFFPIGVKIAQPDLVLPISSNLRKITSQWFDRRDKSSGDDKAHAYCYNDANHVKVATKNGSGARSLNSLPQTIGSTMSSSIFLLTIFSGLIHAGWNLTAKRSSLNLSVNWLAQLAALGLLSTIALAHGGITMPSGEAAGYVLAAGVIQALYFLLLSLAYRLGDVSVVYPIARGLGVAGANIVGLCAFAEQPTPIGALGVGVVSLGTATIGFAALRRSRAALTSVGLAILIGSTLAIGSFVDKRGVLMLDPFFYLALVYAVSAVTSAPYFLAPAQRPALGAACREHKRSAVIIGFGASLGYVIILFAFRLGPVGYTAAVREVAVVLGAALGIVVLKEAVTLSKVVGVVAILTGIVLIRLA